MRFSYADLTTAVRANDVARLQEILRDRDPATGRPYLDINNMPGVNLQDRNLLFFIFDRANPCLHEIDLTADSTREMVLSILAVRDNDNNPVINLNATTIGTATTFEKLFSQYKFLSESNGYYGYQANRQNFLIMVDALINARNAVGDRILDVDTVGYESPLLSAITLGDADLVSMLLDLRNADGSFAIDVNIPYFIHDPQPRSPLDAAHVGHTGREHMDRADFQPNARILQMLQDRGALRYTQLSAEQLANYQAKNQRMQDDLWRRGGLEPIVRAAPPIRAAAPVVRDPILRADIIRPPVIAPAPVHAAPATAAAFDRNAQNTHTPEVERTVDLSILQLKGAYASAEKPAFTDVRRDIEALINEQVGGRLYTAEQIGHIRRGFSYVCNNPESLHVQSSLKLPEIMTLVWLGIHDKSKMPEDFPASSDKDLFVKTRRTALLDKFLSIATTYPGGGTSCLGGTRNLIVSTLDKAHPDVSIAPTSEAVKELGLEQAKRFMLDKLKELSIREQRNILRTWNELDGDGEEGKTPATKFKERVKPLLNAELTQKLGTILPADFFTTLDAQYEYFPEPVVHRELADLCKKIRELPDDLFDGVVTLKSTTTNASIFSDKEGSFDDEYQQLKSSSALPLRLLENKSKLDQLISDIEKYNKDKSESRFSKNDTKSEGATALLGFLRTLKTLDKTQISRALDTIEGTLASDEKKYFGLKFDTWFFAKERKSELKSYYERAKTLTSEIVGDQRVRAVPVAHQ